MLSLNLYKEDFNVSQDTGCLGIFLGILITLLLAITFGILFFEYRYSKIIAFIIIATGILFSKFLIRKLYPDWPKSKNFIGKLKLSSEEIEICSEVYKHQLQINECKELLFFFDHYKGFSSGVNSDPMRTGNSLLFFKSNDGVVSIAKFNINSYKEFENFKLILAEYKMNVTYFKEYIPREINVILKADLSDRIIYNQN